MAPVAALGGAFFIGCADFLGGLVARRTHPLIATLAINAVALVVFAISWALLHPHLDRDTALLGVGAGLVTAVSLNLIYAAFAAGAMSLTAPLIACGSALVPTVATAITGHPPLPPQFVGIALALTAVFVITWNPPGAPDHVPLSRRALVLSLLASLLGGVSFAMQLLATHDVNVPEAIGVASVTRLTATFVCLVLALGPLAAPRHPPVRLPRRLVAGAGLCEAAGTSLFLIASTGANSAVVAVIVSLYAVVTVLLAQTVLRERIARHQKVGIVAAAVGVALLSKG